MIFDISKLVLAEHAAMIVGQRTKRKETVMESIGTQNINKKSTKKRGAEEQT
jgi:hypothetical protein